MNLRDVEGTIRLLWDAKRHGRPILDHPELAERIGPSRIRDLTGHLKKVAQALGRNEHGDVDALELTDATIALVESELKKLGYGPSNVENTMATLRFLHETAIAMGAQLAPALPKVAKPHRHKVNKRKPDGRYQPAVRTRDGKVDSYGLRFVAWTPSMQQEWLVDFVPRFTDPDHEHFHGKVSTQAYLDTQLNQVERAYGAALQIGHKLEDLSLVTIATIDFVKPYRKFLRDRRGGMDTTTTKGDLDICRRIALDVLEDKKSADEIALFMRNRCNFIKPKEETKRQLLETVHADKLYELYYSQVAHARWYELTVRRKYGVISAEALMAWHWMAAALLGFVVVTWLREASAVKATVKNLVKRDGRWNFAFERHAMKGKRPFSDQVVDLWIGQQAQAILYLALDKAAEYRYFLVEKRRLKDPGASDPEAFFLNQDGNPYTANALKSLFPSMSVKWLGEEYRVNCHSVRSIVPTWLFVRDKEAALPAVQMGLDHKNLSTTYEHYLQVQSIFGRRMAQLELEEREKKRKRDEQLARLPSQILSLMDQKFAEMASQIAALQPDDERLAQIFRKVMRELMDGDR